MKHRTNISSNEGPLIFKGIELISPFAKSAPFSTLEIGEKLIVLYTDENGRWTKELGSRNVCAFDETGRVVWIIESPSLVINEDPDFIIGLGVDENGGLFVSTADENWFDIDVRTGKILKRYGRGL